MNLFAESDHIRLNADPELFDRTRLMDEHGPWGHQLLRAATALEILTQLTDRTDDVLLKGGTLLQNSLGWPPPRASVDLDLEVHDRDGIASALQDIANSFTESGIVLTVRESPLPGFAAELQFPRSDGPDWLLRIDILETNSWPARSHSWDSIPVPWEDADAPIVPPEPTRAAQKLLMAAEPPYGRDLSSHLGRQSMIKDQFDLFSLASRPIDGWAVVEAASEDINRKSSYLDQQFERDHILATALERLRLFAPPPVDEDSRRGSLWRAHDRIQSTIRTTFSDIDLRTTTGCSHHAISAIDHGELSWTDTWRPATERKQREVWDDRPIEPVIDVRDDFGPVPGPREAWAIFVPR